MMKQFWATWIVAVLGTASLFFVEFGSRSAFGDLDPTRATIVLLSIALVFLTPLLAVLITGATHQARHEAWLRKRYPNERWEPSPYVPVNDHTNIEYWEVR